MAMTAQNMRGAAAARPNPFGTVRAAAYRAEPYRAEDGGTLGALGLILGIAAAGGAILGILLALAAAWL